MEKISKFNKPRAFDNTVGPGKNPKSINVGPTFIPESRVEVKFWVRQTFILHFLKISNFAFLWFEIKKVLCKMMTC